MTKTVLLNQLALGLPETKDFVLDHFEGDMVIRKISDTTYIVGPVGTVFQKDRDGNIFSRTEDSFKFGYDLTQRLAPADTFPTIYRANGISPDSMFPLLVRKESQGWKILGNGIKVSDVWLNLTNQYQVNGVNSGARTMFALEVTDTAAFPVKSVMFSGTQAPNPVPLSKNAELADANTWHYWWTDSYSQNTFMSPYPNQGWGTSVVHKNGDTYRFVVTFEDNSTQTFEHTITNIPSNWSSLNASVTAGSSGVTATWTTHPWDNFDQYYISVHNNNVSGDNRILEKEIGEKTNTSFTFAYQSGTAYTLSPGTEIGISIESQNRWGFSSSYWTPLTIPQY